MSTEYVVRSSGLFWHYIPCLEQLLWPRFADRHSSVWQRSGQSLPNLEFLTYPWQWTIKIHAVLLQSVLLIWLLWHILLSLLRSQGRCQWALQLLSTRRETVPFRMGKPTERLHIKYMQSHLIKLFIPKYKIVLRPIYRNLASSQVW